MIFHRNMELGLWAIPNVDWDLGLGSEARGILESGWGNRAGRADVPHSQNTHCFNKMLACS